MSAKKYLGNAQLKAAGVALQFTKEQIEEYIKCADDPIYFIEEYCKIVTLDHGLQPFKLYDCQKKKVKIIHDNSKVILMEGRSKVRLPHLPLTFFGIHSFKVAKL